MNYALVCKLQSIILSALTMAFLLSGAVALIYDGRAEGLSDELAFILSAAISGAAAFVCFLFGRRGSNLMFRKEALTVVGLGWIVASVFGALPYVLIYPEIGWTGAIFESASGFTTTGASVLSDLETLPESLLFWRSATQWIGGLGVVVFFVAVLSFLGAGAKVLFSRESSAQATELDTARVQQGILRLMYYYLGLSVACYVAFHACGLNVYDALNHMMTTVSTGGFSTRSLSVGAFENPTLEWSAIVFMALGGTSFIPIIRALRGNPASLRQSTEIRYFYGIIVVSTIFVSLFLFLESAYADSHTLIRTAAFQVVSIITTTGFVSADFNQWLPVNHVILLTLMIVGGCTGSTSGGAKVLRIVVAQRICFFHIEKAYRARVVRPLRINGQPVDSATQESVVVFLVLMAFILIGGTLGLGMLEPQVSLEGLLSATHSCLFNIGPGFAEVGAMENFGFFGDSSKLLLSLLMILGRVELFAILALFSPALWKRF
jgi:trk system potassium uptake protein TrkH